MLQVREPVPGDIEAVGRQAAEEWARGQDLSFLFNRPLTKVVVINGVPVAAGGFVDCGNGLAIGWTLIGNVPQRYLVALCRTFRRLMMATSFHRIEAHCFEAFKASHRWVECVGFTQARAGCFTPAGKEFRIYAFRNGRDGN